MKFYANQIDKVTQSVIDGNITSILLHGPDSGVISDALKYFSKKLSKNIRKTSDEEKDEIPNLINNTNLFGNSEIIRINVKQIRLDSTLKNILTSSNQNLPIFIADEIDASNSYKKFYESEKGLASIGCYNDESYNVKKIITNIVTSSGKRISTDAVNFLSEHISGNRNLIKNEINKLIAFKGEETIIDLNDAMMVCNAADNASPDKLCIYFAKKEPEKYLKELAILLDSGVSVIWILRAIGRFYNNLLAVKLNEKSGMAVDSAIAKLKPRLFFKIVPEFKNIVRKISVSEIASIIEVLIECEIHFKTYSDNEVLDKLFLTNFTSISLSKMNK